MAHARSRSRVWNTSACSRCTSPRSTPRAPARPPPPCRATTYTAARPTRSDVLATTDTHAPPKPPPQLVRRCADRRTGSAQVVEREEEPQARQPRCCQGYAWRRLDRAEVEMRHAATAVIATAAAAAAAAPTAAAARQDSARPAERRDGDGSSCGERRRQPGRRLRETAVDEGRPAGARGGGSSPRLAAVPLALRRQRDACCFGVGWRRAEEVEGVRLAGEVRERWRCTPSSVGRVTLGWASPTEVSCRRRRGSGRAARWRRTSRREPACRSCTRSRR